MIFIDDYVSVDKPSLDDYEVCVGVDLTAAELDQLVELLPRMTGVSVSTLLHTSNLDQFCRDMLVMRQDYVNIEIWTNHADELLHLMNHLTVKIDFVKSR